MEQKSNELISMRGFLAFQILHELTLKSSYGDELAEVIGKRKGSKLTPGTIYPVLKNLRKKKLISHKKEGRKKVYSITEIGVNEYEISKKKFVESFNFLFK